MSAARYVPERGDLLWLTFGPQAGREQAGRRPALVLSPAACKPLRELGTRLSVTTKAKGYPFEVTLPADLPFSGFVLADDIKSADSAARGVQFGTKAVLTEMTAKLRPLLGV